VVLALWNRALGGQVVNLLDQILLILLVLELRDGDECHGPHGCAASIRYQHPVLDSVREATDQRNLRHNPRHNELRVQ
jgi:hypothetical protein